MNLAQRLWGDDGVIADWLGTLTKRQERRLIMLVALRYRRYHANLSTGIRDDAYRGIAKRVGDWAEACGGYRSCEWRLTGYQADAIVPKK